MPDTSHADRLVAEAQAALVALDDEIASMRDEKLTLSASIARLLDERKPLARIVSAAKGRQIGNGDGPSQPE